MEMKSYNTLKPEITTLELEPNEKLCGFKAEMDNIAYGIQFKIARGYEAIKVPRVDLGPYNPFEILDKTRKGQNFKLRTTTIIGKTSSQKVDFPPKEELEGRMFDDLPNLKQIKYNNAS